MNVMWQYLGALPWMLIAALLAWAVATRRRNVGLVDIFWSLFFLRMGVGIGEASASAPGQSLITSYVPPEDRSRSLSVIAIGSGISAVLARSRYCTNAAIPPS